MPFFSRPDGGVSSTNDPLFLQRHPGSQSISAQQYLQYVQSQHRGGAGSRPAGSSAPSGVSPSAEEQRYLDQSLSGIEQLGQGQRSSINQQYQDALGSMMGNLASRGLDASTLQISGQLGIERAKNQANLSLEDMLLGQKQDVFKYGAGLTQQGLERGNRLDLQGMENSNRLRLQQLQSSSDLMRSLLGQPQFGTIGPQSPFVQNPNLQREMLPFGGAGSGSPGSPGASQVPGYILNPFAGR